MIGSAREARAAGRSDLWLGNYADAERVLGRRRRRRRRAVLERHQPGARSTGCMRDEQAPRPRPVPRSRACRASTSGGCSRCRSPTSRCCTSRRRRCRRCRSASSGRSTSPSPPRMLFAAGAGARRHRDRHQADRPRPGAVPPAAGRARRRRVRDPQVPLDVRRRRGRAGRAARRAERAHRPVVQADRRPARHDGRSVDPGVQPRRAAAAAERAARRHEPRRAAAGAAVGGRRVPRRAAGPPPVRPGITGLWQVEARDNPSFEAYRRLDLFYVDNWSLLLDLDHPARHHRPVLVRPFMSRAARTSASRAQPLALHRAAPPDRASAPRPCERSGIAGPGCGSGPLRA